MESALEWHTAKALLDWQIEMGVDETISDAPMDRFAFETAAKERAAEAQAAVSQRGQTAPPVKQPKIDPIAEAEKAVAGVKDLGALRAVLDGFPHCDLKRGARNLVFSDGVPNAKVMFVGEAPGRDEDLQGKPFVGRAGQLLDKMLAAIDLSRRENVYITNVLPWRPPQNRDPKPDEIAMMLPFLKKHIALVNPDVVVIVGNISCQALLGKRGITRLRGQWTEAAGCPALPMFHPAYLLRNPAAKREAWEDLLELRAKLETLT